MLDRLMRTLELVVGIALEIPGMLLGLTRTLWHSPTR